MKPLGDFVREIIDEHLAKDEPFTALDISKRVRQNTPFVKHKEVRDIIRLLYSSIIEPQNWTKTFIDVTLLDGSVTKAALYHPLSVSWDLDNAYSQNKRQQSAVSTVSVNSQPTTSVSSPTVATDPKDLWSQLFDSQQSLFPNKL